MSQITLRVPPDLVPHLKDAAAASGRSLNSWATAVLAAAVDPDLADDEAQRTRERLARAGLLARPTPRRGRPSREAVARARRKAGKGKSLASIVSEERR